MDATKPRLLITGATGKVGQAFLNRVVSTGELDRFDLRAITHNRDLPQKNVGSLKGTLSDRDFVRNAMGGVTHVLHLATCKETPEDVMDVAVKGMFWLLEEARTNPKFQQFILIGGDAAMGHFFYPRDAKVTEETSHSAYPGCYALSKVLEEVMLEQAQIQYDFPGCCLRAPWIMEMDDFRFTLSFGDDIFGGPRWRDLVGNEKADQYQASGTIPVLCDANGKAILRNFIHVDDLVGAIILAIDNPKARGTFNVCMDEPVDYRKVAEYLSETRNLDSIDIRSPYFSTWLDNSKARSVLGWQPRFDLEKLIDDAFDHQRSPEDPRVIWYPG